ncbi:MAG: hypothetical protein WCI41_02795 [bacterium]
MTDVVFHNIRVSYDESHERVRNFVTYLKDLKRKEEMTAYYDEARGHSDGKIHIDDGKGNEFTLVCRSGHNCELRLRGM